MLSVFNTFVDIVTVDITAIIAVPRVLRRRDYGIINLGYKLVLRIIT